MVVVYCPAIVSAASTTPGALLTLCPSAASTQKELRDDIPLFITEFVALFPSSSSFFFPLTASNFLFMLCALEANSLRPGEYKSSEVCRDVFCGKRSLPVSSCPLSHLAPGCWKWFGGNIYTLAALYTYSPQKPIRTAYLRKYLRICRASLIHCVRSDSIDPEAALKTSWPSECILLRCSAVFLLVFRKAGLKFLGLIFCIPNALSCQ